MPDIDLDEAIEECLKTHPTGNCTCEDNRCGIYNGSISDWNTANVTDMSDLFKDHDKFITNYQSLGYFRCDRYVKHVSRVRIV